MFLYFLYAPATIGRGAYCFTPVRPFVTLSKLVCIVCPANSSYSFWARSFIFCRQLVPTLKVCILYGFWFSTIFFTKLCIYELSHWNLLTCKQHSLYYKSTNTKPWFWYSPLPPFLWSLLCACLIYSYICHLMYTFV